MQELPHSLEAAFSKASDCDFYAKGWWAIGSRDKPH